MSAVPALPTSLPALDNTLGALYIGTCLSTLLSYSLYCMMVAGMYRFLVSDFANPIALEGKGAGGGKAMNPSSGSASFFGLLSVCLLLDQVSSVLLIQLFFCWRIWRFSASSLQVWMRIGFVAIMVPLAFFNFASYVAMGIFGFQHTLHSPNAPNFSLVIKLAASSGMAFDVIMTLAMITSLYRARSGVTRSDHVITLLTLFTVNTNLITTLLSVGSLVTVGWLNLKVYTGTQHAYF
ncbi:hypothetical protein ARMGADRAFT_1029123 [Armillaria gallica]|uniref:DUF6534 domain-containing protein n=1 Tax=Armillaria gallica TaxID=47427 RepID=A0A2H3E2G4_ARMGA|nr:hypothetical protein ARMGADRAFT_1029123 [Armillaria gallica]